MSNAKRSTKQARLLPLAEPTASAPTPHVVASRGDIEEALQAMPALIGSIVDIAAGVGGDLDPGFTEYDPAINVLRAIVRARCVQHQIAAGLGVYETPMGAGADHAAQ